MQHAGEGHFAEYLAQEHTGHTAFRSTLRTDFPDPGLLCLLNTNSFKRYEKETSSPSDTTSFIVGIYHSPISNMHIRSSLHRDAQGKMHMRFSPASEWALPLALPAATPMVVQMTIFLELLSSIHELVAATPLAKHDPIAVHLEVDLFTYRAIMMFAETYKLKFRFFPTPMHPLLNTYRAEVEQARMESEAAGTSLEEGAAFQVPPVVRSIQYHLVAYCPACAKHLIPGKRKRCTGCRIACYCNAECQKKDWQGLHKEECKKFKKLIAEGRCEYCKEEEEEA